jgi:hypothetical protein
MVERSLSSFEGHVVFAGEGSSILPWGLFVMRPISILALYSLRESVSCLLYFCRAQRRVQHLWRLFRDFLVV